MKKFLIAIAGVVAFSSCTEVAGWFGSNDDSTQVNMDSSSHAAFARDESITAANAYSNLFLDSNAIESYIAQNRVSTQQAQTLRNFYKVRNYQFAWFSTDGPTEQARGLWSLHAKPDDSTSGENTDVKLADRMDSLLQSDSLTIGAGDSSYVHTELSLTQELINYAGRHPEHISYQQLYYLVPAKKMEPMQYADSVLNKQKDTTLYASNKYYGMLKQQLAQYYAIAQKGGWGTIAGSNLKKGVQSPAVTALKKRLSATGHYVSSDTTAVFSDSLGNAIRNFQLAHGFKATGTVNDSLLQVLNVPVEERIAQILLNMNRALWMPPVDSDTARRIEVNIPEQMLYVYSDSGKVMEMPVIIGKEGDGTVMFSSEISQLVFNPAWNIPSSIVKEEIMPKMKKDATYLKKKNMEIVSNGEVPVIKQLPGKDNPLGEVKFLFPNTHDIYLHDTPHKNLFAKNDRALSHGCIRVADAKQLAEYLLRDQKEWDAAKINSVMQGNEEQTVKLNRTMPVTITYFTVRPDENGQLSFLNDVYGRDVEAKKRMFV